MKDLINTIEEKDLPELNKFEWQDPLLLDTRLSDSERLLAKSVREFAEKNLMSRVEKAFQNEKVDLDVFKLMGEMGLLGSTIPEHYGGIGANYISYGLIAREIERIDSAGFPKNPRDTRNPPGPVKLPKTYKWPKYVEGEL